VLASVSLEMPTRSILVTILCDVLRIVAYLYQRC
jgi:hypothetical protein